MRAALETPTSAAKPRVEWVDYAKGICIILVVMFHTVNHYEAAVGAEGWMRAIVDFSKPFRMPDFFLISGLFLSLTINGPLRTYIDRKVIHFAYFYLMWLAITLVLTDHDVLRANPLEWARLFVWNIIQPVGVLWFVHMLAIFYVVTRLIRNLPKWGVFAVAAAFQIAHQSGWIDTPSYALNRAMDYYVFFFAGYAASDLIFAIAKRATIRPILSLGVIASWAVANFVLTSSPFYLFPGSLLLLGFAGALAIVEISALLSMTRFAGFLRYCGQNSIVIYLTFIIPLTVLERVIAPSGLIQSVGWASALILTLSVAAPLAFHYAIKRTPLIALYERPKAFRLKTQTPAKTKPSFA